MKVSIGSKTISYPLPVYIVGSYDKEGKPNIMAASWGGICNSKPPMITISIRPERHSYDAILANNAFTVNIPSSLYAKESDYVGIFSGKNENKFESTGLTPVDSEIINAPYVQEFPVNILCSLYKTVDLGSHTQFIGEIKDVLVDDDKFISGNKPDIMKIDAISYDYGGRAYHKIGEKV